MAMAALAKIRIWPVPFFVFLGEFASARSSQKVPPRRARWPSLPEPERLDAVRSSRMETTSTKMKTVYTVTERGGKSYWTRIGVGFTNRDGSLNLKLEAWPINGNLQVRDYDPAEGERRPNDPSRVSPGQPRTRGDLPEEALS
jgi:hypothetical protein